MQNSLKDYTIVYMSSMSRNSLMMTLYLSYKRLQTRAREVFRQDYHETYWPKRCHLCNEVVEFLAYSLDIVCYIEISFKAIQGCSPCMQVFYSPLQKVMFVAD